jgi:hypothetical protein
VEGGVQRLEYVDLGQLIWKQTGFGARDFELGSGDDLVGVLYWPKLLSYRAVAESAEGRWHLDRVGFFRRRVVVTEAGSSLEIASFEPNWFGEGDLVFSDGRMFHWYRTKALCDHWALADESDHVVLEIRAGMRWFKYECDVVLYVGADLASDTTLLILIGWYLLYMKIQDLVVAVAATC